MTASNVSKVVLGKEVLVDLTADTVTPETLLQGITAHDAAGQQITGTASAGKSIAMGTISGSGNQTLKISGLSFTPQNALIAFVDSSSTYGYTYQHVIAVDTQRNRCALNVLDMYGNSLAEFKALASIKREAGAITVTVPNYNALNGQKVRFSGAYSYVVWSA